MKFLLFILLCWSFPVMGYPQFVKDGYFACSTCHVSQAGGDALTPYGRTMAEQKLAMSAFEGEGQNTWSATKNLPNLLLGGRFRRIQIFQDSLQSRSATLFNMQREMDTGLWSERLAAYVTWGLDESDEGTIRKWIAKWSPLDHASVSVGAFRPKYGLNLNDHGAYVVASVDQQIGNESEYAEAAFYGEIFEVTVGHSLSSLPDRPKDVHAERRHQQTATLSWFVAEAHRLVLSWGKNTDPFQIKHFGGVAGTAVFAPSLTASTEFNWINEGNGGLTSQSLATYLDLVWEPTKGLWIQPFHEMLLTDRNDPRTKLEKQGLRLSLFPRPHFDVKGAVGQIKDHNTYQFRNYGSLLFHFWL